jgi:hypothetical protein
LARLLAALRLPAGDEDEQAGRRPQRRVGVRGVYDIGNTTPAAIQGRQALRALDDAP